MLAIPVVGSWISWLVFGGEFPGTVILDRLYIVHVLLIPGILLALIAAHLTLVWYQKHTQFPGPGRTERNVIGVRIMPVFALNGGGMFAMVFGTLALMGGLFQINPIWNYGPYDPAQVSAGSQPDWFMGFTDGIIRLWPAWEMYIGGHTIPQPAIPAMLLGVILGVLVAYPFIERKLVPGGAFPGHPQPAATPAGRAGAHLARCHGDRVLRRPHRRQRRRPHRLEVLDLAERHHLGAPYRHAAAAPARLCDHLPVLHRSAALRPGGAQARGGDRHHPPGRLRRVHRDAPTARRCRRAWARHRAGLPGRTAAQEDEHARRRGVSRPRQPVPTGPPEQVEALNEEEHEAHSEETRALSGIPDAGKPSESGD